MSVSLEYLGKHVGVHSGLLQATVDGSIYTYFTFVHFFSLQPIMWLLMSELEEEKIFFFFFLLVVSAKKSFFVGEPSKHIYQDYRNL